MGRTLKVLYGTPCLFLAIAALLFASCNNATYPEKSGIREGHILSASIESPSRTSVEAGGTKVLWDVKEDISVFLNGATNYKFTSLNTTPSNSADFEGSPILSDVSASNPIRAVSPYKPESTFSDDVVDIELPATQQAVDGTYDPAAHIMAAYSSNTDLQFYNVTGGIRFTLCQSGITSITFSGNDDEPIAGRHRLWLSDDVPQIRIIDPAVSSITLEAPSGGFKTGVWYYISITPTDFRKGFTLDFKAGKKTASITTDKRISINRGTFGSIAEIDKGLVFTDFDSILEEERSILIDFYNATGGDNWINKENWCSDKPVNEWFGIITDENGRVTEIHLDFNGLSGTIPESFYGLQKMSVVALESNRLSGELSEKLWEMSELSYLRLYNNQLTGGLTSAIGKAKKLRFLGLGANSLKGTIPDEITELTILFYFSIENHAFSGGTFTYAANEFSGTIPSNLDRLQNLQYFLVENNNLEGGVPACFGNMPKLIGLELYGNRLSGEIPEELVKCANWDNWAPDANIVTQQPGYILTFSHYESTDYSSDGKVTVLQAHEKGNGVPVVITGDCFTDQDIAAGDFDRIARQTMEDFFAIEPFTTFRNLFDIFAVSAVSKSHYSCYGTALEAEFGQGSYVYCSEDKVKEYSSKAVSNLDEVLTIVIINKNKNSGTSYLPYPMIDTDYGSGFSYACFGLIPDDVTRRLLINHEANGHGFTKLMDEYSIAGSGEYPKEDGILFKGAYFKYGFCANIDFDPDPATIQWARFLTDERYKYDGLGVFEGGYTYERGVWHPSENSIMCRQSPEGDGNRFNAPSRLAAYYRIHKLAYGDEWVLDFEEFVKYDAINRKTAP